VTASDVAGARAATASRTALWTVEELEAALPRLLPAQAGWKATASHNAPVASRAFALNGVTTWSTGARQEAGMWFQVELPEVVSLVEIQFESPGGSRVPPPAASPGTAAARPAPSFPVMVPAFPRAYKVEVSLDGATWTGIAEGKGLAMTTVIAFPAARAKFVRMTQTALASDAPAWTIQRLRLYQPPES
jgi:hypothetical protein